MDRENEKKSWPLLISHRTQAAVAGSNVYVESHCQAVAGEDGDGYTISGAEPGGLIGTGDTIDEAIAAVGMALGHAIEDTAERAGSVKEFTERMNEFLKGADEIEKLRWSEGRTESDNAWDLNWMIQTEKNTEARIVIEPAGETHADGTGKRDHLICRLVV